MLPHYIGSILSMMVLLSASVTLGFDRDEDKRFVAAARLKGIKRADALLATYLPVSVFYLVLFMSATVIYQVSCGEFGWVGILSSAISILLGLAQICLIIFY